MNIFIVDPNLRFSLDDIKDHKMFRGINWERVKNREDVPPITPDLRDELDLKYFHF